MFNIGVEGEGISDEVHERGTQLGFDLPCKDLAHLRVFL